MSVKYFTKGSDTVSIGDIVTVEITIERLNNLINGKAQNVHSNNYNFIKAENWYVIVCNIEKEAIIHFEIIGD